MMRRETAYRLAGRRHQHEDVLGDARRLLEVRFSHADVVPAAVAFLSGLPDLEVSRAISPRSLLIRYDLAHHSLRELEEKLLAQGFRFDDAFLCKLHRAWLHFCEDTLVRNARAPQRLIKQSNEVYVQAYAHHPHGDHDDTPPELREDR